MTMAAIPASLARSLVTEWVAKGGGTSSFSASEANEFLEFVAGRLPEHSAAHNLCRIEQATYKAISARSSFAADAQPAGGSVRRHPGATVIQVGAISVLFAPGLEGLHREASAEEIAVWNSCVVPRGADFLASEGHAGEVVSRLLGIGALTLRRESELKHRSTCCA
jgi:hypothetical protein